MATKKKSRRVRYEEIIKTIEDAAMEINNLREELQDWLDNLPENLQDGQKADELMEATEKLEIVESLLDEVVEEEIDFPGMISK
jgi:hypothetical protein